MPESPRSSFIPKQTNSAIPAKMQRRRTFHVFGFAATVLLVASLLSASGAYLYKGVTEKRLDEARSALRQESEKFGSEKLNEVRDFNRQLLGVNYLLSQHISPSKLFDLLEFTTMKGVQFTSFSLGYEPSTDIVISVQGGTQAFKTIALQALKFGEHPLLKDAVFSGISSADVSTEKDKAGEAENPDYKVSFTVSGAVSPELLMYEGFKPDTSALEGDTSTESVVNTETVNNPI